MEKLIIVGGGVSGLSCLNALVDQGHSALLLEANSIGSEKMCGEFLAPPAVNYLKQWHIGPIQPIVEATFFANNTKGTFYFKKPAGALSRQIAEEQLAKRARAKGAIIQENCKINKIIPANKNEPYIFYLTSGEKIAAKTVIFATGKINHHNHHKHSKPLPYFGIKLHFPVVLQKDTLFMHSLKGAYFGMVPISEGLSNCTFLIKRKIIEEVGSCRQFLQTIKNKYQHFAKVIEQTNLADIHWFETQGPDFSLKKNPQWPNAFWIGDAFASFYPAIGYGFSYSIVSGILAAECYLQKDTKVFQNRTKKTIIYPLLISQLIHNIICQPRLSQNIFPFLQKRRGLYEFFFKKIGYL